MRDVIIKSFQHGGTGNGDKPTESVGLAFEKIDWRYKEQDQ